MQLQVLATETYHIIKNNNHSHNICSHIGEKQNNVNERHNRISSILTGSFVKRSSESRKPNMTSDWLRYVLSVML